jgi:hypothetical protein
MRANAGKSTFAAPVTIGAPAWLESLIIEGVIAGVGGVLVYVPGLMMLFFFLALLEDSGYLARAAFILDRLMARVGLHGRAFVVLRPQLLFLAAQVVTNQRVGHAKDSFRAAIVPFQRDDARDVVQVFGSVLHVVPLAVGLTPSPQIERVHGQATLDEPVGRPAVISPV